MLNSIGNLLVSDILQIFYPLSYYTCMYQKSCNFVYRKMPKKDFDCVKCGGVHERPINSKCKVVEKHIASTNENVMNASDSNVLILQELKELK